MDPQQYDDVALIGLSDALTIMGLARSSYYYLRDRGRVPPALKISGRKAAVRVAEMRRWLADPTGYRATGGAQ